ncbi:hypothetical protein DV738_g1521, partial [Chaetothyriales sp. CBS 135597]
MSVEATKAVGETQAQLAETPVVEAAATASHTASAATAPVAETPVVTESAAPAAESAGTAEAVKPVTETTTTTDAAAKTVTPASEGVLGFKAPGFLKQLYYSKHFFWFSDEPVASDSLDTFVRNEKADSPAHQHAAWARETGKGVLFHSKRAEDKAHPSGVIPLHDVTNLAKEGFDALSFKLGSHTYKFEAPSTAERDSWLAALEKKVEEARALKDEIVSRDSYKKNLDDYVKSASLNVSAAASRLKSKSKSKEPKESKETKEVKDTKESAAGVVAATETKAEETATSAAAAVPAEEKKVEEKKAQKERSQSRKRASIFGAILPKKEEKEVDTEAKKETKTDKLEEAASKPVEAAQGAADEDKPTTPNDKKTKRGSVFGALFKKPAVGANVDKADKDVGPATPAKDVHAVSETAPKLDEPIENKPIDAAAPKTEKKSGFLAGLIKKAETKKEELKEFKDSKKEELKKEEAKEDKATTDGTTEITAPKDERPAVEKRRPSLFASLGTIKRKSKEDKEGPDSGEESPAESKPQKSPLTKQIGDLLRRPSKAIKAGETKDAAPVAADSAAVTEGGADAATTTTKQSTEPVEAKDARAEATEAQLTVDQAAETVASKVATAVTTAPEVKASA